MSTQMKARTTDPPLSVGDALTAFNQASQDRQNAMTVTASKQEFRDATQAQLDSADTQLTAAKVDQAAKEAAYQDSIDDVIAAFEALKPSSGGASK